MRLPDDASLSTPDYSGDLDPMDAVAPALHEPLNLHQTDYVDWSEMDDLSRECGAND